MGGLGRLSRGRGLIQRETGCLLHHGAREIVWNSRQSLGTLGTLPFFWSIILASGLLMVKGSNLIDLDLTGMTLTHQENSTQKEPTLPASGLSEFLSVFF